MIASSKAMDTLKGIGLNLYERRLWVALLARGTSTAGELSEIAKVPRSRAYDTLESLAEKGFVLVQSAKPIKYLAISPDEALDRVKKKMEQDLIDVQQKIDDLKSSPVMKELAGIFSKGMKVIESEDLAGSLKGKHLAKQQMGTIFKAARQRINIVATAEGVREIHDHHYETLKRAKDNGVSIRIVTVPSVNNQSVVRALSGIAEVRHMAGKEPQIDGDFCIVDGRELMIGLTDPRSVHDTQHVSLWSKSDHAAGNVFDPMFNMVWGNSKPVARRATKAICQRPMAA